MIIKIQYTEVIIVMLGLFVFQQYWPGEINDLTGRKNLCQRNSSERLTLSAAVQEQNYFRIRAEKVFFFFVRAQAGNL